MSWHDSNSKYGHGKGWVFLINEERDGQRKLVRYNNIGFCATCHMTKEEINNGENTKDTAD